MWRWNIILKDRAVQKYIKVLKILDFYLRENAWIEGGPKRKHIIEIYLDSAGS